MENWDDVRFFLAVAKAGSVSAGAQLLGVNHSTVSRRIASFETNYGVRLFERMKMGVQLTQAAENILQWSQEMETLAQGIGRSLVGRDARLQGKLTITMPSELAANLLIEPLAAFQEQYPEIDLHLTMAPGLRNLAKREADVAIRLAETIPDDLIGIRITHLQYGFYCSQEYIRSRPVPDRIIRWQQGHCNTDWAETHFPDSRTTLTADVLTPMIAAVRAGMGIARLPIFAVSKQDSLHCLGLEQEPSRRSLWVLSHPDLNCSARLRVCREFIVGVLTKERHLFSGESTPS